MSVLSACIIPCCMSRPCCIRNLCKYDSISSRVYVMRVIREWRCNSHVTQCTCLVAGDRDIRFSLLLVFQDNISVVSCPICRYPLTAPWSAIFIGSTPEAIPRGAWHVFVIPERFEIVRTNNLWKLILRSILKLQREAVNIIRSITMLRRAGDFAIR